MPEPDDRTLSDAELSRRLRADLGACPACGSAKLDATFDDWLHGDLEVAYLVGCGRCGASWSEDYRFHAARCFEPGPLPPSAGAAADDPGGLEKGG
jgi:hypothetical protein